MNNVESNICIALKVLAWFFMIIAGLATAYWLHAAASRGPAQVIDICFSLGSFASGLVSFVMAKAQSWSDLNG